MLGIIGEYLWRTLAHVRRREMYLIDAIYEAEQPGMGTASEDRPTIMSQAQVP
jgi:hypothetical protein